MGDRVIIFIVFVYFLQKTVNFCTTLTGTVEKTNHFLPVELSFSEPLSRAIPAIINAFKLKTQHEYVIKRIVRTEIGALYVERKLSLIAPSKCCREAEHKSFVERTGIQSEPTRFPSPL